MLEPIPLRSFFSQSNWSSPIEPEGIHLGGVVQADKMDSLMVETLPSASVGALSKALQIRFAGIANQVVLAGHEEYLFLLQPAQELIQRRIRWLAICVKSPVCRMKSGWRSRALILSTAA